MKDPFITRLERSARKHYRRHLDYLGHRPALSNPEVAMMLASRDDRIEILTRETKEQKKRIAYLQRELSGSGES